MAKHKLLPAILVAAVALFAVRPGFAQEQTKYWVMFTDKVAPASKAFADVRVVSEAARKRRDLRGRVNNRALDLPVAAVYLEQIARAGGRVGVVSRWLNAASVWMTTDQVRQVRQLPFVSGIAPVRTYSTEMAHTPISSAVSPVFLPPTPSAATRHYRLDYGPSLAQLQLVNAVAPIEAGIIGSGVVLGFLDTTFGGFSHEVFAQLVSENRLLGQMDFSQQPQFSIHGLAVASVAVGFSEGNLIGPAYGASVLAATTEQATDSLGAGIETNQEEDNLVAGLEWMESQGADVVNISLGYSTFDAGQNSYTPADLDGNTAITTRAADIAASLGVVVVNSAGNSSCGSPQSCWYYVTTPSDGDSVISVGAVMPDGQRASFSGRGPTADGRIKPDVSALGTQVIFAGGSGYGQGNGTSFSAPMVAGIVAQMLQVNPSLTPVEVRNILRSTAGQAASPDNSLGWGIVNADAAIAAARTVNTEPVPPQTAVELRPIFPNPAAIEAFLVVYSESAESARVRTVDVLGRTVSSARHQLDPGRTEIAIPASGLPSGRYVVIVEGAFGSFATPLTISR